MKFFEDHFNRHHLFHKPHKWFLALLVSPLHAAEMHYKRKYHLTFRHAKKLFFFDMLLLLSTALLFVGTLVWHFYDPTVTDLVSVSLTQSEERVQSGESITYTVSYKNYSDVTLEEVTIAFDTPEGFLFEQSAPSEWFDTSRNTFTLPDALPPGAAGEVRITGVSFETPEQGQDVVAHFSYIQEGRERREVNARRSIATLRGSVLAVEVDTAATVLGNGSTPISITLRNTGERPLEGVTLPFPEGTLSLTEAEPDAGTVEGNAWNVGTLEPGAAVTLSALLNTRMAQETNNAVLAITPSIRLENRVFPQATARQELTVEHPAAAVSARWEDTAGVSPGGQRPLQIVVTNTGDTSLSNMRVTVPLTAGVVDQTAVARAGVGSVLQGALVMTANQHAGLAALAPGESTTLIAPISIAWVPSGAADLTLQLAANLTANVPAVPGATFRANGAPSNVLAIGTQLLINAQARYYTLEGDQLGRGPLPPQVGKETKYWILIDLQNTTSDLQDVHFSAKLPATVRWTGRTSVSLGRDIQFDPNTRTLRWSVSRLAAGQTAGIRAEIGMTPTPDMVGQAPRLLESIFVSAQDGYINAPLQRSASALDTTLPNDPIGRARGVLVQ